jgi:3-isopropylmalate/(R)-2-methylmalate dehydratase small subunit
MKKVELIRSRLNPLVDYHRRPTGEVPGVADDVDTDQIIPARFLKTTGRAGLGQQLFADWRGKSFDPTNDARILLAGNNFGCGSSREHAVWALTDFGFEAVIARSFADIFRANALKNGLVPVAVDEHLHRFLVEARANNADLELSVDVGRAVLVLPDGEEVAFPLDPFARQCLTQGIDELEYLRRHETAIAVWEARHA